MATCWFIVIESRGQWWVDCEGRAYGPLENKDEAIRYARKIAETYGDPKRQPPVWVPRSGGRPELIWSGPKPEKVRDRASHPGARTQVSAALA